MLAFAFKSYTLEADLTKNLLLYQSPLVENENTNEGMGNADGSEHMLDESLNHDKSSLGMGLFSEINDNYDAPEEKALSTIDMLSISMSGIVRPLKSRILQVITSLCRRNDPSEGDDDDDIYDKYNLNDQEDDGSHIRTRVGQLYDICGLLLFYYTTILRSVSTLSKQASLMKHSTIVSDASIAGASSKSKELNPLLDCILECFVEATQGYEATVRVYCAMIDQIAMLSGESIATLMQRLLVLLIQIRTNSPGYLEDVTQECPNAMCRETLSMEWVTETLISTCFNILTISIDDVITIKELFQITKRNSNICFDVPRAMQLEALIAQKEQAMIDELIKTETFNVFDLCGLTTIVKGWERYKNEATTTDASSRPSSNMSTYPGLTSHEIETGIKEFYTSLYSPPIPSFEMTIQDPITRKLVRSNIANAIVSFYTEFYTAMQSDVNSYDETTRYLFQHTPQEVRTLFSI
jgi:conserved oligomeric Golgi complex subunit 6